MYFYECLRERTAYEYITWRDEYHNRLIQERLDSEERKRQKQTNALKIKKQKEAIDERNRREYQKIFQMTPTKQVDYIVNDDSHNLLFYMPVINRLLDIDNISSDIYRPILERLSKMAPTPFNLKLIKRIQSRLNKLDL